MKKVRIDGKKTKVKSADGVTGCLIRSAMDKSSTFVFRVYKKKQFTDYEISHWDMNVKIVEPDAFFYDDGERQWIDYDPETFGLKNKKKKGAKDERE